MRWKRIGRVWCKRVPCKRVGPPINERPRSLATPLTTPLTTPLLRPPSYDPAHDSARDPSLRPRSQPRSATPLATPLCDPSRDPAHPLLALWTWLGLCRSCASRRSLMSRTPPSATWWTASNLCCPRTRSRSGALADRRCSGNGNPKRRPSPQTPCRRARPASGPCPKALQPHHPGQWWRPAKGWLGFF